MESGQPVEDSVAGKGVQVEAWFQEICHMPTMTSMPDPDGDEATVLRWSPAGAEPNC